MTADEILAGFWEEVRQNPDLPLQHEGMPEACQCGTEEIIRASQYPLRTRAVLLIGCAIRDALRHDQPFPADDFLRERRYIQILNHGPDASYEAPQGWVIDERYAQSLSREDWDVIADVARALIADFKGWVAEFGQDALWPEFARKLEWISERVHKYDAAAAEQLRRACLGHGYFRYAHMVDRLGAGLFRRSEFFKQLVPEGRSVANGNPLVTFANLADVRGVDIVVFDRPSMTVEAICQVKTVADSSKQMFEMGERCADVMRRARASGIRTALGVVRLNEPVPFRITEPGNATMYRNDLVGRPASYTIEYHPDGAFSLEGRRFLITLPGTQLALTLT